MNTEDFKKQKAQRIVEIVEDAHAFTAARLKEIHELNRRKLFVKKNRRPMKKQRLKVLYARIAFSTCHQMIQIAIVQSQPIPKFPKGSSDNAIVGN